MRWNPSHRRLVGALAVLIASTGACGGDAPSAGCGPTEREALDPAYLVHVVGDREIAYTSDPPTSGPHQPSPALRGVVDEPISRPVQVGILERGDVLLQHDPQLGGEALAALQALGGERVVVAPNPDLPDPVVATAWLFKRTCRAVDPSDLQDFVNEHVGAGPQG
jgi:hypothetical protein